MPCSNNLSFSQANRKSVFAAAFPILLEKLTLLFCCTQNDKTAMTFVKLKDYYFCTRGLEIRPNEAIFPLIKLKKVAQLVTSSR